MVFNSFRSNRGVSWSHRGINVCRLVSGARIFMLFSKAAILMIFSTSFRHFLQRFPKSVFNGFHEHRERKGMDVALQG